MSKNLKFFLALGLQILIILVVIIFKVAQFTSGTEVLLKLAPIDPRDPLRGDYLNLRYDITTLNSYGGENFHNGDIVYVPLQKSGLFWTAGYNGPQKNLPAKGDNKTVYIKGTIMSGGKDSVFGSQYGFNSSVQYTVKYNIESYFVPEGKGNTWELTSWSRCNGNTECMQNANRPENQPFAKVAVDDNGNALLKQLYIDGKPWPQGGEKLELTDDKSDWPATTANGGTPLRPFDAPVPPQNRYYVSGSATDSSTGRPLTGVVMTSEAGQVVIQNSYFTLPVSPTTTVLTFQINGYKPVTVNFGPDSPNINSVQDLGIILFEPTNITYVTYKSVKFGYSFSYPASLQLQELPYDKNSDTQAVVMNWPGVATSFMQVSNMPNYYNYPTLETYAEKYITSGDISRTFKTINGKKALEIQSQQTVTTLFMSPNTKQVYTFLLWSPATAGSTDMKIYDKILQSFKY